MSKLSEMVKLHELKRVPWVNVRRWSGHVASTRAVPSVWCHHWDPVSFRPVPRFPQPPVEEAREQVGRGRSGEGQGHEQASGWRELRVWEVSPKDPAPLGCSARWLRHWLSLTRRLGRGATICCQGAGRRGECARPQPPPRPRPEPTPFRRSGGPRRRSLTGIHRVTAEAATSQPHSVSPEPLQRVP